MLHFSSAMRKSTFKPGFAYLVLYNVFREKMYLVSTRTIASCIWYVHICRQSMCNGWHVLQSFLQMLHTTLGMWLMLIYMTFNVWLIISLTLGSGIGYFLFAWKVRTGIDIEEPCHWQNHLTQNQLHFCTIYVNEPFCICLLDRAKVKGSLNICCELLRTIWEFSLVFD